MARQRRSAVPLVVVWAALACAFFGAHTVQAVSFGAFPADIKLTNFQQSLSGVSGYVGYKVFNADLTGNGLSAMQEASPGIFAVHPDNINIEVDTGSGYGAMQAYSTYATPSGTTPSSSNSLADPNIVVRVIPTPILSPNEDIVCLSPDVEFGGQCYDVATVKIVVAYVRSVDVPVSQIRISGNAFQSYLEVNASNWGTPPTQFSDNTNGRHIIRDPAYSRTFADGVDYSETPTYTTVNLLTGAVSSGISMATPVSAVNAPIIAYTVGVTTIQSVVIMDPPTMAASAVSYTTSPALSYIFVTTTLSSLTFTAAPEGAVATLTPVNPTTLGNDPYFSSIASGSATTVTVSGAAFTSANWDLTSEPIISFTRNVPLPFSVSYTFGVSAGNNYLPLYAAFVQTPIQDVAIQLDVINSVGDYGNGDAPLSVSTTGNSIQVVPEDITVQLVFSTDVSSPESVYYTETDTTSYVVNVTISRGVASTGSGIFHPYNWFNTPSLTGKVEATIVDTGYSNIYTIADPAARTYTVTNVFASSTVVRMAQTNARCIYGSCDTSAEYVNANGWTYAVQSSITTLNFVGQWDEGGQTVALPTYPHSTLHTLGTLDGDPKTVVSANGASTNTKIARISTAHTFKNLNIASAPSCVGDEIISIGGVYLSDCVITIACTSATSIDASDIMETGTMFGSTYITVTADALTASDSFTLPILGNTHSNGTYVRLTTGVAPNSVVYSGSITPSQLVLTDGVNEFLAFTAASGEQLASQYYNVLARRRAQSGNNQQHMNMYVQATDTFTTIVEATDPEISIGIQNGGPSTIVQEVSPSFIGATAYNYVVQVTSNMPFNHIFLGFTFSGNDGVYTVSGSPPTNSLYSIGHSESVPYSAYTVTTVTQFDNYTMRSTACAALCSEFPQHYVSFRCYCTNNDPRLTFPITVTAPVERVFSAYDYTITLDASTAFTSPVSGDVATVHLPSSPIPTLSLSISGSPINFADITSNLSAPSVDQQATLTVTSDIALAYNQYVCINATGNMTLGSDITSATAFPAGATGFSDCTWLMIPQGQSSVSTVLTVFHQQLLEVAESITFTLADSYPQYNLGYPTVGWVVVNTANVPRVGWNTAATGASGVSGTVLSPATSIVLPIEQKDVGTTGVFVVPAELTVTTSSSAVWSGLASSYAVSFAAGQATPSLQVAFTSNAIYNDLSTSGITFTIGATNSAKITPSAVLTTTFSNPSAIPNPAPICSPMAEALVWSEGSLQTKVDAGFNKLRDCWADSLGDALAAAVAINPAGTMNAELATTELDLTFTMNSALFTLNLAGRGSIVDLSGTLTLQAGTVGISGLTLTSMAGGALFAVSGSSTLTLTNCVLKYNAPVSTPSASLITITSGVTVMLATSTKYEAHLAATPALISATSCTSCAVASSTAYEHEYTGSDADNIEPPMVLEVTDGSNVNMAGFVAPLTFTHTGIANTVFDQCIGATTFGGGSNFIVHARAPAAYSGTVSLPSGGVQYKTGAVVVAARLSQMVGYSAGGVYMREACITAARHNIEAVAALIGLAAPASSPMVLDVQTSTVPVGSALSFAPDLAGWVNQNSVYNQIATLRIGVKADGSLPMSYVQFETAMKATTVTLFQEGAGDDITFKINAPITATSFTSTAKLYTAIDAPIVLTGAAAVVIDTIDVVRGNNVVQSIIDASTITAASTFTISGCTVASDSSAATDLWAFIDFGSAVAAYMKASTISLSGAVPAYAGRSVFKFGHATPVGANGGAPGVFLDEAVSMLGMTASAVSKFASLSTGAGPYVWWVFYLPNERVDYILSAGGVGTTASYTHARALALSSINRWVYFASSGVYTDAINLQFGLFHDAAAGASHTGTITASGIYDDSSAAPKAWVSTGIDRAALAAAQGKALARLMGRTYDAGTNCGSVGRTVDVPTTDCTGVDSFANANTATSMFPAYVAINGFAWSFASGSALVDTTDGGYFSPIPFVAGLKGWTRTASTFVSVSGNPSNANNYAKAAAIFVMNSAVTITGTPLVHDSHTVSLYVRSTTITSSTSSCSNFMVDVTANTGADGATSSARLDLNGVTMSGVWCSTGGMARYTALVPTSNADFGLPLFKHSASMLSRAASDNIPIVRSTSSAVAANQRQVLGIIQDNWVVHPTWFAYGVPTAASNGIVNYYSVGDVTDGSDGLFTWPNTYSVLGDVSTPLAIVSPLVQPAMTEADGWMGSVARTSGDIAITSGNTAYFRAVSGGDNVITNIRIEAGSTVHFDATQGTPFTLTNSVIYSGTINRNDELSNVTITSTDVFTDAHQSFEWLFNYNPALTAVANGATIEQGRTTTFMGTNLDDYSTESGATVSSTINVVPTTPGAAVSWTPVRLNQLALSVSNSADLTITASSLGSAITDFTVTVATGATLRINGFSGSMELPSSGYIFNGAGTVRIANSVLTFTSPSGRRRLLANTDCLYAPGSTVNLIGTNVTTDKCLGDFVSFSCSDSSSLVYQSSALSDAFVTADTVNVNWCHFVDQGTVSGANRIGRGLLWGDGGASFSVTNSTFDVSAITHDSQTTGNRIVKAYSSGNTVMVLNQFIVRSWPNSVSTASASAAIYLDLHDFNGAGTLVLRQNRINDACLNYIPPLADERLSAFAARCAPYNGIILAFDSQNDVNAVVTFANAYGIDYVCDTDKYVRILNLANPRLVGTYIDVQSSDTVPVSSSNAGGGSVCYGAAAGTGNTVQTSVGFASDAYVAPATFTGNLNLTVWMNSTDLDAVYFIGLTPYNTSRTLAQNAGDTICNNYYGTNLTGFDPNASPPTDGFKALYNPRYVRSTGVLHTFNQLNMTSYEYNVSLLTMDGFEGCGDLTVTTTIENGKWTYLTTFTVYAYVLQNVETLNVLAIGHQSAWEVSVRMDSMQNVLSVSVTTSSVSTLYTDPSIVVSTDPATLGLWTFSWYTMTPDLAGTDVTLRDGDIYHSRNLALPLCDSTHVPALDGCRYNCTLVQTAPPNAASAVPSLSQSHTDFSIQFWQAICYNPGSHILQESFSFVATPYYGGAGGTAMEDSLFGATFHLYDSQLNIQLGGVIDMNALAASIGIGLQTEVDYIASQGAWNPVSPSGGVYSAFKPTDRIALQMRYDRSIVRASYTDATGYNTVERYRPAGAANLDVVSMRMCASVDGSALPIMTTCGNGIQACSCGSLFTDPALITVPISNDGCATSSNPHTATCYTHLCGSNGKCETGPLFGGRCSEAADCQLTGYAGTCRYGTHSGSPCNVDGDCPVSQDLSMCNKYYTDEQRIYALSPAGRRVDSASTIGYIAEAPTVPCTAVPYAQYLQTYQAGSCVLSQGKVKLNATTYTDVNGYINDFYLGGFVGEARQCLATDNTYRACKLEAEATVTAWNGVDLWNAGAAPCAGGVNYCRHESAEVTTSFRVPPAFYDRAIRVDVIGHVAPMPQNMEYVTTGLFPAPSADEGVITVTADLVFNSTAQSMVSYSLLVSVPAPAAAPSAATAASDAGVSTTAIIGIVCGCIALVLIVTAVVFFVRRRRMRQKAGLGNALERAGKSSRTPLLPKFNDRVRSRIDGKDSDVYSVYGDD